MGTLGLYSFAKEELENMVEQGFKILLGALEIDGVILNSDKYKGRYFCKFVDAEPGKWTLKCLVDPSVKIHYGPVLKEDGTPLVIPSTIPSGDANEESKT